MKKFISVVGVGIVLAAGGCAQVSSGKIQELESSISQAEGGSFGTFITQGHNCADNLYHAKMHLTEGQRVSGKFMNSSQMEIDQGIEHASEAAGQCSNAEQSFSAYIDENVAPLESRVQRLEGFH